jgi:hypothetical protein
LPSNSLFVSSLAPSFPIFAINIHTFLDAATGFFPENPPLRAIDRALKNPVSERQESVSIVVFTAISSESQDLFPTPAIAELIDRNVGPIDRRAAIPVGRAAIPVGRAGALRFLLGALRFLLGELC